MKRRMQRTLAGVGLALSSMVILSGCGAAEPAESPAPAAAGSDDVTIRIGAQPVLALSQWWAADKLGYFEENGVNVELAETYPAGAPQVEAGLRGDWDIAFTGELPAITAGVAWDLQTIGYFGDEPSAHGIYVAADSGITTANAGSKLKGQPVLYTQGSTDQLFFEGCLKSWGLDLSDVQAINLAPPELVTALQSGSGVAGSAYPPFAFVLETAGFTNICDTKKLDVQAFPTMVVRKEFLKEHPDAVARFTEAVFRANAVYRDDADKSFELAKGFYTENGVTQSDEDIKRTLGLYNWVDLAGGEEIFASGAAEKSVNAYQDMLVRNGLLMSADKPTFLNDSALTGAAAYATTEGR